MTSREELLRRVRDALKELPDEDDPADSTHAQVPRHVPGIDPQNRPAVINLFVDRLKHYGAQVHRITEPEIPQTLADILHTHDAGAVVTPDGLPREWVTGWAGIDGHRLIEDESGLTPTASDRVDAVVTTCAGAVADSGTIVLDGGPGQGRRASTLIPDCHICVVRAEQVDSSLPEALDKLDPGNPVTWFSGPSATVDIDMVRVPGVHGPRRLIVVIIE